MNSILAMLTMKAFWEGALTTIILFFFTLIIALPLGLPFALGSNSKIPPIRWICKFYIWVMRGTPLMLQLFFFYFFVYPSLKKLGFMQNVDLQVATLIVAIFTFALNYAAYFAEIYRGGIASVNKGQYEAAQSLGMSRSRTLFGIILPQTFKAVLPPIFNETITLVKDTALASVISVAELMRITRKQVSGQVNPLLYIAPALFYLLFTFVVTMFAKYLEGKTSMQQKDKNKGFKIFKSKEGR